MPTAAPLRARDLTVVRGPLTVLDGIDLVVAPGRRIGVVGPNGVGKSTLLQALAGLVPLDAGTGRAHAADGDRRVPAAGAVALGDETVTAFLARRTGVAAATRGAGGGDGDAGRGSRRRRRSVRRRARALAGARRRRPRRPGRPGVGRPRAGRAPARPADGVAVGRRGGARRRWPRCCWPASTCSCSTSRRTTSTSTASTASSGGSPSSPAAVVLVSHDRTFLARTVTDVVELDEFTHRATALRRRLAGVPRRARGGPARRLGALRGVRQRAQGAGPAGPAGAGVGDAGPVEGAQVRRAGQEHPGLQDQPDRAARRAGGPHRAGASSGSRSSTSRGSRGSCG